LGLQYSLGWIETQARRDGYFDYGPRINCAWEDVILQGPHFTVANPFAKVPREKLRSNNDWDEIDLESLQEKYIPRTSYQPVHDGNVNYDSDYTHWVFEAKKSSARDHFRVGWRLMAATSAVRTFYPTVVPPGAAHTNSVVSCASESLREPLHILATVGHWA